MSGYFLNPTAATDPARAIRHIILHNVVRVRGKNSVGIAALMDGALVRDNHVTTEGPEAVGISTPGSQAYIGQNLVDGIGVAAVSIAPSGPMSASGNEIFGNEFDRFKASTSDVILGKGTVDNRVTERSGTLTDLGSGNHFTGLKEVSH
jgi:hypothetical protein